MAKREEQIDTYAVTTREIMSAPAFAAGVADVRAGKPARYDAFADDAYWAYERGRQFALLAPRSMRLRDDRNRLNWRAVLVFNEAYERGDIR
jgi:hypothetical protein